MNISTRGTSSRPLSMSDRMITNPSMPSLGNGIVAFVGIWFADIMTD